ncbi:hypothetical protein J7T55_005270 [Diaporthe amygdali]|uniref:uncharacterized protein n=1 Tax=Phomopsis amygdali TaxID=1214568 RepID=UPI0022FE037B|nr:uncharacterized protein J7T55_005270 [Diaporthe amygdali]KAJ0108293.1 hypothetical protein J7T55_005270 [Diaporthe amygdali]
MGSYYQAQWPLKNLALIFTAVPLRQYMSNLQTEIQISAGSFANPGANVRPRFRYWLPDASVDADTVAADIAAAGSIGAGGIELLSLFEYGGELGSLPAGADWATYNFGAVPFRNIFAAALTAHEENGRVMEFSLSPNQGQGMPATPDNPAAVPENGSFSGVVPGRGAGELVSFGSKNLQFTSIFNSIFDVGSYVFGHFDAISAETAINSCEEYILVD